MSPTLRGPFLATRAISTTPFPRALYKTRDGTKVAPTIPESQAVESEYSPSEEEIDALRVQEEESPDSGLAVPRQLVETPAEREAKALHPEYEPARSLQELETLPGVENWWEKEEHWGPESQFKGFARTGTQVQQAEPVIEVYLRRALVEVLALKQAGKWDEWATKAWPRRGDDQFRATLEMDITESGELKQDASHIVAELTNEELDSPSEGISESEGQEILAERQWGSSWTQIPLDAATKFALRKRVYQFSGYLIPDSRLGAAHNVGHLLALGCKKPKPAHLASILEQEGAYDALSNVKAHAQKISFVEKEKSIGRWKVIEEELKARGLPVLGANDAAPKHKEQRWIISTFRNVKR
ncbi:uncharacterized protein J7T54_006586 [Emericellopsis cladophorae]|uniref:Large ribosomal subunit protein mL50 n=1 Tax=Emericellopsis cladophorae TaxID=2686198 RepID=A0A9P9Y6T1_9HYPO|nr:uncharacterized protein J7T54_006586 [Emericellopsis cladophorae]KAI6784541.1 hypothetical protein J7T54_006586 [Emericellopsis cladophorae]